MPVISDSKSAHVHGGPTSLSTVRTSYPSISGKKRNHRGRSSQEARRKCRIGETSLAGESRRHSGVPQNWPERPTGCPLLRTVISSGATAPGQLPLDDKAGALNPQRHLRKASPKHVFPSACRSWQRVRLPRGRAGFKPRRPTRSSSGNVHFP